MFNLLHYDTYSCKHYFNEIFVRQVKPVEQTEHLHSAYNIKHYDAYYNFQHFLEHQIYLHLTKTLFMIIYILMRLYSLYCMW